MIETGYLLSLYQFLLSDKGRGPVWLSGKVFGFVIQGSWVQAALDPLDFFMDVSLSKTLQS